MSDDFQAYVASRSVRLVRLAWLLTGDVDDAEDVVQTALARVFASWNRVSASDDVDAYVRRVIINANHSRRRRRRVAEAPLALAERAGRLDAGLTVVADRSELDPALRSLPRRQREVLVLRYIEDLSEQETATVLGCSVSTVKTAARRGLARLREHPAFRDTDARTSPMQPAPTRSSGGSA